MIELEARAISGYGLVIHEEERLVLGFTENGFPVPLLKSLFPGQELLFLKQVHSGRVISPADWRPGIEADGLLLERPGAVAVIQTADCVPLFFFDDLGRRGGILHVGWRGLQQGIERNLAGLLGGELARFSFLLGPAIEKKCYEVGEDLVNNFSKKPYAKDIFSARRKGKYSLDLKAGLRFSLAALGVPSGRILDCGLCTYCSSGRFPSYRRDGKTGRRIYNFLALKGETPSR